MYSMELSQRHVHFRYLMNDFSYYQQINHFGFVWARSMASEDTMTKWLQECSQGIVRLNWRHHTGAIDYKDHIYK